MINLYAIASNMLSLIHKTRCVYCDTQHDPWSNLINSKMHRQSHGSMKLVRFSWLQFILISVWNFISSQCIDRIFICYEYCTFGHMSVAMLVSGRWISVWAHIVRPCHIVFHLKWTKPIGEVGKRVSCEFNKKKETNRCNDVRDTRVDHNIRKWKVCSQCDGRTFAVIFIFCKSYAKCRKYGVRILRAHGRGIRIITIILYG